MLNCLTLLYGWHVLSPQPIVQRVLPELLAILLTSALHDSINSSLSFYCREHRHTCLLTLPGSAYQLTQSQRRLTSSGLFMRSCSLELQISKFFKAWVSCTAASELCQAHTRRQQRLRHCNAQPRNPPFADVCPCSDLDYQTLISTPDTVLLSAGSRFLPRGSSQAHHMRCKVTSTSPKRGATSIKPCLI